MAKKIKLNLINDDLTWSADRRYKVNSVASLNGEDYQNITGKNSSPDLLIDWQKSDSTTGKVNKSGIEVNLPILDASNEEVGSITHSGEIASFKGKVGTLLDAPATRVNSLSGYTDYLVGIGLDGQLIPVKKEASGSYAPIVTYSTPQNISTINTPTKLGALITTTQALVSPTLQWSVNFTNTTNQVSIVKLKLGLNNIPTGTYISYNVPKSTTLVITGASPYAPTIITGTEVSVFLEADHTGVVNSVTIKLDSGIQSATVDQTIIQNSTNAVAGGAVYTGLAGKFTTPSGLTTNYLPKWNGSAFGNSSWQEFSGGRLSNTGSDDFTNQLQVNGSGKFSGGFQSAKIFDNGTNVGIGNTVPLNYPSFTSLTIGDNNASRIGIIKLKSTYNAGDGFEFYQSTIGDTYFNVNGVNTAFVINENGVVNFTKEISASPAVNSNQVVVKSQHDLKANLASPVFTGTPTAPTATAGTNTTQVANTIFVSSAITTAASSGSYTPTYSSLSNISSLATSDIHYTIVNKVVTVRGRASGTLTTANTATSVTLTLPFLANSVASVMGNGTASQLSNTFFPMSISSVSTTTAKIDFFPTTGSISVNLNFSFSYVIP